MTILIPVCIEQQLQLVGRWGRWGWADDVFRQWYPVFICPNMEE